jgi:hypothetical protein
MNQSLRAGLGKPLREGRQQLSRFLRLLLGQEREDRFLERLEL